MGQFDLPILIGIVIVPVCLFLISLLAQLAALFHLRLLGWIFFSPYIRVDCWMWDKKDVPRAIPSSAFVYLK